MSFNKFTGMNFSRDFANNVIFFSLLNHHNKYKTNMSNLSSGLHFNQIIIIGIFGTFRKIVKRLDCRYFHWFKAIAS